MAYDFSSLSCLCPDTLTREYTGAVCVLSADGRNLYTYTLMFSMYLIHVLLYTIKKADQISETSEKRNLKKKSFRAEQVLWIQTLVKHTYWAYMV